MLFHFDVSVSSECHNIKKLHQNEKLNVKKSYTSSRLLLLHGLQSCTTNAERIRQISFYCQLRAPYKRFDDMSTNGLVRMDIFDFFLCNFSLKNENIFELHQRFHFLCGKLSRRRPFWKTHFGKLSTFDPFFYSFLSLFKFAHLRSFQSS